RRCRRRRRCRRPRRRRRRPRGPRRGRGGDRRRHHIRPRRGSRRAPERAVSSWQEPLVSCWSSDAASFDSVAAAAGPLGGPAAHLPLVAGLVDHPVEGALALRHLGLPRGPGELLALPRLDPHAAARGGRRGAKEQDLSPPVHQNSASIPSCAISAVRVSRKTFSRYLLNTTSTLPSSPIRWNGLSGPPSTAYSARIPAR